MPSQLELVNRVLSEIGRQPITAINDSPAAQTIAAKIDELMPELLQLTAWNFAIVYRSDSTPLTTNFSPDYVFSYALPGDFGGFYKWASAGAQWPFYAIVDGMMLANTNPIQYYYITNQVDFSVLTPLFSRMLVLYVASKVAPTLTNNMSLAKYLTNEYFIKLSDAVRQNDMERSVMSTPYNDFDRTLFI